MKEPFLCGSLLFIKEGNNIYSEVGPKVPEHTSQYVGCVEVNGHWWVSYPFLHSEKSPARPMLFYSTNYWHQF